MKAAMLDRYGPPDVLVIRDVPQPEPKAGEVLIRVHASVATPSDCAFRSADPFIVRFFAGLTRPKHAIIGTVLAGEVVKVGEGVTRFRTGDRVYGSSDVTAGTHAEYICQPAEGAVAPMPRNLDYGEAAGISEGFLTAMPFLRDEAKLAAGQRLLVNGASGCIGTVAVPLAKHMGAHVTAVCSTRNVELVRGLGADEVIDYTREDFTGRREAWDAIFDAVGKSSFARCRRALTPHGIYMTTVPSFSIVWPTLRARMSSGKGGQRGLLATTGLRSAADKAKDLELLTGLCEAGVLKPVIDRTYPLEAIAEAHRYVETGRKRGSVVVAIAEAERAAAAAA